MKTLPFVEPDREFTLNYSALLIIVDGLFQTKRGKKFSRLRGFNYFSF